MNLQEAQAIAELEMFYRLSVEEGVLLLSQLHERDRKVAGVVPVVRNEQKDAAELCADGIAGRVPQRWFENALGGVEGTEDQQGRATDTGDAG